MIVLLDAYNILKQTQPTREISDAQRRAFIDRVERYAHARDHAVFIVFDGGTGRFPSKSNRGPVQVIYSGTQQSADDVVKRLCAEYAQKQVVVVSSDRQVCAYASLKGAVCLDADLWESVLAGARENVSPVALVKDTGVAHKRPGHESTAELDALMQQASSQMMVKAEDDHEVCRKSAKQTLSKAEKQLKKLVKKL